MIDGYGVISGVRSRQETRMCQERLFIRGAYDCLGLTPIILVTAKESEDARIEGLVSPFIRTPGYRIICVRLSYRAQTSAFSQNFRIHPIDPFAGRASYISKPFNVRMLIYWTKFAVLTFL